MSLVAEFTVRLPRFEGVLGGVPDMELVIEGMTACDPETLSVTFWADGNDFGALETGLGEASMIHDVQPLSDRVDGRKLYQIRLPAATTTYWVWTDLGGVLLDGTLSHTGMWMRMRYPDREAFSEYHDHCQARGCSFELTGLKCTDDAPEDAHDLTAPQTELLAAAVDKGYFDVPRRITMGDLASEFDISTQAASERLRRGLSNALQNSILDGSTSNETIDHPNVIGGRRA